MKIECILKHRFIDACLALNSCNKLQVPHLVRWIHGNWFCPLEDSRKVGFGKAFKWIMFCRVEKKVNKFGFRFVSVLHFWDLNYRTETEIFTKTVFTITHLTRVVNC